MTTYPTILFVHGAWHNPSHYAPVTADLESQGYPCVCPHQPPDGAEPPAVSMLEDAAVIRAVAEELVEEGCEVVVVGHSYGGVVATQAIPPELSKQQRTAQGLLGGVKRMFYMCAFLLPPDGRCHMLDPKRRFYSALPAAQQEQWLALTRHHCASAQLTPLTHAAYKEIPATYLYTEKDEALPLGAQKMMVNGAGVEIAAESCAEGDHSPYLSCQGEVVAAIKRAAASSV